MGRALWAVFNCIGCVKRLGRFWSSLPHSSAKNAYEWGTRLLKAKCGDVHHRGDNAMDYQGFTRLIDDPVWAGG